MKIIRSIFKWIFYLLIIPIAYLTIALILTFITNNGTETDSHNEKQIYLSTNRVHLEIIIPVEDLTIELKKEIQFSPNESYLSFGWGEENFFLNTPTWGDLTFSVAFRALFLKNTTLIHVTRYKQVNKSWTKVLLGESELEKLNHYILNSFKKDESGKKIILNDRGYSDNDDFYKANGNYSCFNTCNTWVNKGFKESNLKSCLWTPFDFGLIRIYD